MPHLRGTQSEDPRAPINRLRRGTLKRICREAGLEFNESTASAEDLRNMVRSNDLDLSPYMSEAHKLGAKEPAFRRMARMEKENEEYRQKIDDLEAKVMQLLDIHSKTQEKVSQGDELPESFDGLPMWRLRQLCKTVGVKALPSEKAEDLVKKLNEYVAERRQ